MAKNYYYIDGNVSAGQSTLLAIENESASFGIGATTDLETEQLTVTTLKVGTAITANSGIITANSLDISETITTNSLNISGVTTTFISGITTVGLGSTSNPPYNAQMSFELTSNTNLRIKVRGTDGVLRSGNITLS